MDSRPIGVFDSGLGGLSVIKELNRVLPDENIIYFGDTGRVPYGTRSAETIVKYAKEDEKFLLSDKQMEKPLHLHLHSILLNSPASLLP